MSCVLNREWPTISHYSQTFVGSFLHQTDTFRTIGLCGMFSLFIGSIEIFIFDFRLITGFILMLWFFLSTNCRKNQITWTIFFCVFVMEFFQEWNGERESVRVKAILLYQEANSISEIWIIWFEWTLLRFSIRCHCHTHNENALFLHEEWDYRIVEIDSEFISYWRKQIHMNYETPDHEWNLF